MNISKKRNRKKILIIGHGFLAKSLINNFSKRSNFNIFCISKIKKYIQNYNSNVKFIDISKIKKTNFNIKFDVIINTIGNINHDNFNSQTENQILNDHFLLPKMILEKIKKDSQTLFIQIGSIDELEQINKKEFYQTPYAFFKNYFSNYLLTLKNNKVLNVKIIYLNSVFGKYQKKDRLIPLAIDSLKKNKLFFPKNPHQKRNFISSEEFATSIEKIITKHKKFQDKIIIKSKFNYKVGEIVSFILENKNIKKYISTSSNYKKVEVFYINEKINIKTKLKKVIDFYINE